jgi:hypothetical protein
MTTAARTRKSVAKAEKHVLVLNRYFVKSTHSIVCHVRNGGNKEYMVTLNANGTSGCIGTDGVPCESSVYGKKCYHIKDCLQKEIERTLQIEAEMFAAMREKEAAQAQDEFPYGCEIAVPEYAGEAGTVVSDVYRNQDTQLLAVLVDVDGLIQCFSVIELEQAEVSAECRRLLALEEALEKVDAAEYDAWKREMGLDGAVSRAEYVEMFDPDGLYS